MPKKGKGKGGKRKGKGKKGKKRTKKLRQPPPLHDLTEIYKKIENGLRTLFDMRVVARKKRLEGWFMTREMTESKNDSELYNDYLQQSIIDLQTQIENFLKLLEAEREALAKAIEEVVRDLEKRLQECLAQSAKLTRELEDVNELLRQYEPFMLELELLMAQIKELLRQIEEAKFDRDQKVRHLTNQFLNSRARLHNHLEEQLFYLINHCRKFVMPILWYFMANLVSDNRCLRWKVEKCSDKNLLVFEKRDDLRKMRKLLTIEKPYWNLAWSFFKLADVDSRKQPDKQIRKTRTAWGLEVDSSESISSVGSPLYSYHSPIAFTSSQAVETIAKQPRLATQLGKDFNNFLLRRLTATREAQTRLENEKHIAETELMKRIRREAGSYVSSSSALWEASEELGEQEFSWFEDEEWEDYEEGEDNSEDEEDHYDYEEE